MDAFSILGFTGLGLGLCRKVGRLEQFRFRASLVFLPSLLAKGCKSSPRIHKYSLL